MQGLITKAFRGSKTQLRGKTSPRPKKITPGAKKTPTDNCGDDRLHFLCTVWVWQHQWIFNDITLTVFDGNGFIPKHIKAPHLAIPTKYLPSAFRTPGSRQEEFYGACALLHSFVYNPDNPLPFHLARDEHGVKVVADIPDLELILKKLPGWLNPVSTKQWEILSKGHYFSLYYNSILFGPLSLVNHSCVAYADWARSKTSYDPPKRYGVPLQQLNAVRAEDVDGFAVLLRKGDKSIIRVGQEVTVRYLGETTGPPI